MMAIRFWPACGEADNLRGPPRSVAAIGSPRATFHHGPELDRSTTRPSVDTSKPAIRRRVKTGQRGRGRRDEVGDYRMRASDGKVWWVGCATGIEKSACGRT